MRFPRMIKSRDLASAFILVADYAKNKRMIPAARSDVIHASPEKPDLPIGSNGKDGNETAWKAAELIEPHFKGPGKRLSMIYAQIIPVELALEELESLPLGKQIRQVLELVYWQEPGYKSIDAAAQTVHIDGSHMGQYIRNFIKRVEHFKYNDP